MSKDQIKSEGLDELLTRVLWPITALMSELEAKAGMSDWGEIDMVLNLLTPIIDSVERSLEALGGTLEKSFGKICIETKNSLRSYGGFRQNDFGKAFIKPPQIATQGGGE